MSIHNYRAEYDKMRHLEENFIEPEIILTLKSLSVSDDSISKPYELSYKITDCFKEVNDDYYKFYIADDKFLFVIVKDYLYKNYYLEFNYYDSFDGFKLFTHYESSGIDYLDEITKQTEVLNCNIDRTWLETFKVSFLFAMKHHNLIGLYMTWD